jgi:hypothetical protein
MHYVTTAVCVLIWFTIAIHFAERNDLVNPFDRVNAVLAHVADQIGR